MMIWNDGYPLEKIKLFSLIQSKNISSQDFVLHPLYPVNGSDGFSIHRIRLDLAIIKLKDALPSEKIIAELADSAALRIHRTFKDWQRFSLMCEDV